jgi:phage-related protein
MGRRPLFWEGSAKRDFKQFPEAVQKDMGVALFVAQLGGTPPSAKPWKGLGPGVFELVEDHRGDTYRAVYLVRIAGMCCMRSRRSLSQGSRRHERMSNLSRRD